MVTLSLFSAGIVQYHTIILSMNFHGTLWSNNFHGKIFSFPVRSIEHVNPSCCLKSVFSHFVAQPHHPQQQYTSDNEFTFHSFHHFKMPHRWFVISVVAGPFYKNLPISCSPGLASASFSHFP